MEPVTSRDLRRLLELADDDLLRLPREWQERRAGVFLAQGAAQHYVDHEHGVKDFDVWSFYWSHPSVPCPWKPPRKRHVDFGTSLHGRNVYTDEERTDPILGPKIPTWERFRGRRVDLMTRTFDDDQGDIDFAVRLWLATSAPLPWRGPKKTPSPWWLARRPLVELWPAAGKIVWDPAKDLPHGLDSLPASE
jgi:hypothetical protein